VTGAPWPRFTLHEPRFPGRWPHSDYRLLTIAPISATAVGWASPAACPICETTKGTKDTRRRQGTKETPISNSVASWLCVRTKEPAKTEFRTSRRKKIQPRRTPRTRREAGWRREAVGR